MDNRKKDKRRKHDLQTSTQTTTTKDWTMRAALS